MADNSEKITRAHCNKCGHETNHDVIAKRELAGEDADYDYMISWVTEFEMLECRGCGEVKLRQQVNFSETDEPTVQYFPPSVSRRLPAWRYRLPAHFHPLMNEVYEALHADSCTLAIMGVRALIDMVVVHQVGDKGNFTKGISALKEKGLVSSNNAQFLVTVFDVGSAAAHRGHRPKISDVNMAMDIAENLLQAVYVLDSAAAQLKESTPPRPLRAKKVGTAP